MPDLKSLDLSVTRESFNAIVRGEKSAEYRDRNAFWKARLDGRAYDVVRLRAGASETEVGFIEVRKVVRDGKGQYAILLGEPVRAQ